MRKSGSASLALFYCEFGDDEKKNLRGLLSSLLFQLHDQSQSYSEILSKLYSEHRHGFQEPSDTALEICLKDIFRCAAHPPIYLIVDALDECPKAYGTPSPRGKVLKLVEELVGLHLPNLRICVTSRPETDIENVLNHLKSHFVSLHEEEGQRQDIEAYVKSVVDSDLVMGTWGEEEKTLVTEALSQRGDRM
jgi:NACHT domain